MNPARKLHRTPGNRAFFPLLSPMPICLTEPKTQQPTKETDREDIVCLYNTENSRQPFSKIKENKKRKRKSQLKSYPCTFPTSNLICGRTVHSIFFSIQCKESGNTDAAKGGLVGDILASQLRKSKRKSQAGEPLFLNVAKVNTWEWK